jgi:hypothetical protein
MQSYRVKNPRKSPLWQCARRHFDEVVALYPEHYEPRYGRLRPIIPEVVQKFLDCGVLERGFARIRCDHCQHEYLLAFSCKSRWFCPSCHQKKVQTSAAFIVSQVLAPVPHRHYVLALPKMLRPYFQRHRELLKGLCILARQCLTDYLRTALELPDGLPGMVLSIHTFGEYLDFHPHLHALVADGLFLRNGLFHVLPPLPIKPLEELFQARVLEWLVELKLLPPERAQILRSWKHTGFNVHAGERVPFENQADLEKLAQYVLRNPFSVDKMTMEAPGDIIIYRSRMNPKINRNFEVFTAPDFLAAITNHIPNKNCQMLRYYGWYSNKMRGQRAKEGPQELGHQVATAKPTRQIIRIPPPSAKRLPSKKWRDLIQKVWHADPMRCPICQNTMRLIAVIDEPQVIERILRHLGLWSGPAPPLATARPPPEIDIRVPCDDVDPMPEYENVLTD